MRTNGPALARLVGDWRTATGPAHRALADRIRLLVLDGRLPLDTIVPGERELAVALGISRTTVTAAYTALRDQGFLVARHRARSRVTVPGEHPETDERPTTGAVDFAHAAPAAPGGVLWEAYASALHRLPLHLTRHGYAGPGVDDLRTAVAARFTDRGLRTSPGQIMITHGAQHALVLLARTLLRPRQRIVVDHPTYPHALRVFREAGCRVSPVPVHGGCWDLAELARASSGAALAYLIPDFHNPTGSHMPDTDRERLRQECPVIVDETMTEVALDVAPARPLAAHVPGVITIGSTAKTFWGGLRIGWIRADPQLLRRVEQARTGIDLGTAVVEQLAAAELLGRIDTVLPARLAQLRQRRTHLLDVLDRLLPDWNAEPGPGGLTVWATLPHPWSSALAVHGRRHGVLLAAGPRFGVGGAFERNLRLPYTLEEEDITEGAAAIARCVAEPGWPQPVSPAPEDALV